MTGPYLAINAQGHAHKRPRVFSYLEQQWRQHQQQEPVPSTTWAAVFEALLACKCQHQGQAVDRGSFDLSHADPHGALQGAIDAAFLSNALV